MNKSIWIINQHASQFRGRHSNLANQFILNGYKTWVFLTSFNKASKNYLYKEDIKIVNGDNNVGYVYVHSKPIYSNNGIRRVMNMLSFCWIIFTHAKKLFHELTPPNYIIASSVHPFVWEIGYYLSKRSKAKFIAEVRDLWPLSLIEIQHVNRNHPLVKLLSIVEKRAYRRADAIVTSMPFAYKYISGELGFPREKVNWMPNGIDTRLYKQYLNSEDQLPTELDEFLTNHWCCIYTGSFVESECIPMMLEAFNQLKNEDIYFAIIGSGHDYKKLIKLKEQYHLDKVRFFPYIKYPLIPKVLSKAKCCIGAIHNYPIYKYGLSLNKLSDYLYSGNPVIFACDHPNVVKDASHFCIPTNATELAKTIIEVKNLSDEQRNLLAEKSRTLIENVYDYNIVAKNYLNLLESL